MSLTHSLRQCAMKGTLRAIDVELGIRLGELAADTSGAPDQALCLATVLAGAAVGQGHGCLPLAALDQHLADLADQGVQWDGCSAEEIRQRLRGNQPWIGHEPSDNAPLIVQHERLYLQRYAAHEACCAQRLRQWIQAEPVAIDSERLRPGHAQYVFSTTHAEGAGPINWQAVACALALRHRFSVLSGGPGTGKTYTVALIALLLLERAQRKQAPCKIALAAPTGKAAQRLRTAVNTALAAYRPQFDATISNDDLAYLQASGLTLHRLLGYRHHEVEFRHQENNPLAIDCLIIDECSMVDLPLMTRTLRALKPGTRVILVGDHQQLYPVEAGSVFAELFRLSPAPAFDPETAHAIGAACGFTPDVRTQSLLDGHLTVLQHSFRADQAVAGLARSVQAVSHGRERAEDTVKRIPSTVDSPISRVHVDAHAVEDTIRQRVYGEAAWFAELQRADTPAAALKALQSFRILSAVKHGPHGVEAINQAVQAAIASYHAVDLAERNYHLRPILVTANDYTHRLFNGDTGVVFHHENNQVAVYFEGEGDGEPRCLPLSQLPRHETCYAMTIHKSQGSEFDHVAVILPAQSEAGNLAHEWLYTAITRARHGVEIWAPEEALIASLRRSTQRYSGLAARLWDP